MLESNDDIEHCYDVLVLHLDGSIECDGFTCRADPALHEWVLSCLELLWPCDCGRVGHTQPIAA